MSTRNSDNDNPFFAPFDPSRCVSCGHCLNECPVMKLPLPLAKREMKALKSGKKGSFVLSWCETCMACNLICPESANPAMLFIEKFYEFHKERAFPEWSLYFQPHNTPNFRTKVIEKLPTDEKTMLDDWSDMSACDEFTYPGCNMCATPYLTRNNFMEDLNIRGGIEYCCGEMYFRTGQLDKLRQSAARLNRFLETLGASKMMVLCTAGYNLFTNVLPRYGLVSDVEITSYLPWLLAKIEAEEIKVKRPLEMSVTIQDSCHSKALGDEYVEIPRRILEKIGGEVKEMKHSKEMNYCCGIGGGFPARKSFHPLAITASTGRVMLEANLTQADAIMAYCSGCLQTLSTMAAILPVSKPIYHILELVQIAAGEKPLRRNIERGKQLLKGMIVNQVPKIFSLNRVSVPDIPEEV